MSEPLNNEQKSILNHTMYRAAGKRYCGDSKDMQELVSKGLMKSIGKFDWCPDGYFTITEKGIEKIKEIEG